MFGKKPECCMCHTSESTIWKKGEGDMVLCNDCVTNKTTCLPVNSSIRKSRSSSPDSEVKSLQSSAASSSSLQPRLKIQRLENEVCDRASSSNKEDDKDNSNKLDKELEGKENSSNKKEDIACISGQSSKSKSSKDKNRKDDQHDDKDENKRDTRRKTRKGKQCGKGTIPKGKGRRYIFKKSVSVPLICMSLIMISFVIF